MAAGLVYHRIREGSPPTMSDDHHGSPPWNPWQMWLSMFGIHAPLSGDVTENIDGGQLGLININATRSGDPQLEQRIITEVASYGRQLGRLLDAVDVLADRQSRCGLSDPEIRALDQLQKLAKEVAAVKQQAVLDRIDRIVADVQALSREPQVNAEAIERVREALPPQE
ncbi:MAG: hypothetical protein ACRDSH_23255 [Pseudonocardiaceae bacterium]